MVGLFTGNRKAKNNEEFRIVLRKRQNRVWCLFGVGLFTIAVSIALYLWLGEGADDYRSGVFCGFGFGLCLGALVSIFRMRRLLADEEKLKEQRLKEVDERNVEIRNLALQATAKVVLAVLYVLMIIGSLFIEELIYVCCTLIGVFFLCYLAFIKYYDKVR